MPRKGLRHPNGKLCMTARNSNDKSGKESKALNDKAGALGDDFQSSQTDVKSDDDYRAEAKYQLPDYAFLALDANPAMKPERYIATFKEVVEMIGYEDEEIVEFMLERCRPRPSPCAEDGHCGI